MNQLDINQIDNVSGGAFLPAVVGAIALAAAVYEAVTDFAEGFNSQRETMCRQ